MLMVLTITIGFFLLLLCVRDFLNKGGPRQCMIRTHREKQEQ